MEESSLEPGYLKQLCRRENNGSYSVTIVTNGSLLRIEERIISQWTTIWRRKNKYYKIEVEMGSKIYPKCIRNTKKSKLLGSVHLFRIDY